MLIWRVRDIVDIVHVLMKVEMTVTFFMEGATFFNQPVSYGGCDNFLTCRFMEGATLSKFSSPVYGGCASKFNIKILPKIFFRVNKAVFSFSPISVTFLITSIHSKAKTTASSIPAWSPTAVLTGPFHA